MSFLRNWIGIAVAAAALVGASAKTTLTPRKLFEAPIVGNGVLSVDSVYAAVPVVEHDFSAAPAKLTTRKTIYSLKLPPFSNLSSASPSEHVNDALEQGTKPRALVYNVSDVFFLGDHQAAWVHEDTLYYKDVSASKIDPNDLGTPIGKFPAPVGAIKVAVPSQGGDRQQTLVFAAEVYDDGKLENVKSHDDSDAEQEWTRVRAYETTFVRHGDKWVKPQKRSQLFAVDVVRRSGSPKWEFSSSGFRNLLHGTKLETPVPLGGGADDFHVSDDQVVFVSKDPDTNTAWTTKSYVYLVPVSGKAAPIQLNPGNHGASSSPRLDPYAKQVIWLQQGRDMYESDKRDVYLHDLDKNQTRSMFPDWDVSPTSLEWGPVAMGFVMTAPYKQRVELFHYAFYKYADEPPKILFNLTSVRKAYPRLHGGIMFTAGNVHNPNELFWLEKRDEPLVQLTSFGKDSQALADVDFGPEPEQLNGWLHKPPGYDASKKYPLMVIIHGGPEGVTTNAWSTLLSPTAMTGAGYVVFTPNPAGSSSFGQAYQEEVMNNWGGAPQEDIVKGVRYILDTMKSVDAERIVAMGGSYGGYSVNWIQGHNQDGLFKALACMSGIFSTTSFAYATDEAYFPFVEMGPGSPWETPGEHEKWSPANYVNDWNTPALITHGGRDYRIPESEALAMFNALQRRGVPSRFLYFPGWLENIKHYVFEPAKIHALVRDSLAATRSVDSTEAIFDDMMPQIGCWALDTVRITAREMFGNLLIGE
ncbi:Dipeptidyl-peptidase 5 [Tilletia horrida]|nr:Dipeptidyl-peptidase 5 [Tilletia horrida]